MRPLTAALLGKAVLTLVLGVIVGAVGTSVHRATVPWGMVGALALVAAAAVTSRAYGGWPTWGAFAAGLFITVQALAGTGPGGDQLVPAAGVLGWVWVLGSAGLALGVTALPRRLFDDRPR